MTEEQIPIITQEPIPVVVEPPVTTTTQYLTPNESPASSTTEHVLRQRTISISEPNPIDDKALEQGQHRTQEQQDVYASVAKAAGVDPATPLGRTLTGTSINVNPPPV